MTFFFFRCTCTVNRTLAHFDLNAGQKIIPSTDVFTFRTGLWCHHFSTKSKPAAYICCTHTVYLLHLLVYFLQRLWPKLACAKSSKLLIHVPSILV